MTFTVDADRFLIAAGAKPRPLEFPGSGLMVDSTAFLELEQLPSRIVFIGGGFVSFEFAHIAARAGATVTILHHSAQLLKGFDPDLVHMLIERSQQVGIGILMSTKPIGIAATGDSYRVDAEQNGVPVKFDCDLVVHGAGRVPAIDDLDLDKAGIAWTTRGVTVHPHLQSTTRTNVFAAGDAADTPGQPLTPVAVFEGKIAASNMLHKGMKTADYSGVPSAVFTIPELVRVGLLESEAKELGLDHRVRFTDTRGWYSQRRIGETHAGAKIILENGTDRILGAHFFGPDYAEVVNIVGLAIRLGLSSADLKTMVSAYPSTGSDLGSLL